MTNWVTLFFIPVIPFGRKRSVHCPICSWGWEENPRWIVNPVKDY